ncbi:MAG: F0F1 ATP synthase subunit A [Planctomycetaceae bacterium]|nr:F0F1 ATP synthase subunit A [Planctomycetaceae bacterium]
MADPILHIKDSYYFEVPKVLAPANYKHLADLPVVWVKLDPVFQEWEFKELYPKLTKLGMNLPPEAQCHHDWQHWVHTDHANFAKPLDQFLQEKYEARQAEFKTWKANRVKEARATKDETRIMLAEQTPIDDFLRDQYSTDPYRYFLMARSAPGFDATWNHVREKTGSNAAVAEYQKNHNASPGWDVTNEKVKAKFEAYNNHLAGKILIPQPFGTLRNLYEPESGFCISKYMLLQVLIGLIVLLIFRRVADKFTKGGPPRGWFWNLSESFLVFIRDQIVAPSIGGGHDEEHHDEPGHGKAHPAGAAAGHGHHDQAHGHQAASHADHQPSDVTRLLPLFWTIFFFILGCNLFGMVPWMGAPTTSFSVTTALAAVTLVVGFVFGVMKFGFLGYWANQIPGMDLPIYMAVIIKPMVFAIEVMGLMIKHAVLAIRLLANMVAGHLVILGIMGVAFGATAAVAFSGEDASFWQWLVAATIAVVASTLFSLLELFVAFLQAYVFTFLSALFIGAAIHKH